MTPNPLRTDAGVESEGGAMPDRLDESTVVYSRGQYNDFRRCVQCYRGYFINALGREELIQCPYGDCHHIQKRSE